MRLFLRGAVSCTFVQFLKLSFRELVFDQQGAKYDSV